MKTAVYSFGEESPMKFEIPDKLAENYNSALKEWFRAQRRFNQRFGRLWNPKNDPISIKWDRKQSKAWNAFAKIFDEVNKKEGPFHETELFDDFLVKNAASIAALAAAWGITLGRSAYAGGLFELFVMPATRAFVASRP